MHTFIQYALAVASLLLALPTRAQVFEGTLTSHLRLDLEKLTQSGMPQEEIDGLIAALRGKFPEKVITSFKGNQYRTVTWTPRETHTLYALGKDSCTVHTYQPGNDTMVVTSYHPGSLQLLLSGMMPAPEVIHSDQVKTFAGVTCNAIEIPSPEGMMVTRFWYHPAMLRVNPELYAHHPDNLDLMTRETGCYPLAMEIEMTVPFGLEMSQTVTFGLSLEPDEIRPAALDDALFALPPLPVVINTEDYLKALLQKNNAPEEESGED